MLPPVAGYAAWYDASDASTITETGTGVSQWDDKSGNGRHMTQGTDANRPSLQAGVLNGRSVVRFNGTSDRMVASKLDSTAGSIFVVGMATSFATQPVFVFGSDTATNSVHRAGMFIFSTTSALSFIQRANDTNDFVTGNTVIATSTYHIFEAHSTGSAYSLVVDGTTQTLSIVGGANTGDWFGDSPAIDNLSLGAEVDLAPGNFLPGDIAEVIIYDSVLSADERDQVWTYLRGKWFGGISSADPLYPINSTTVDTAAGIDIRLLSSAQAGATDSDQSVRFTHTQDGQERTFDPDNALVTTETNPLGFQGKGWALRLVEDMTPDDDINCNAVLTTGTMTVNVRALLNMNGGTNLGGVTTITFRASLWRYNTVNNTGILIDSASQAQTWDTSAVGAENNTRKDTAISIASVPQTEFLTNEVLLLQIGCEGTTLPNASVGTTNFDITLDVDDAGTNLDFAAGQGLVQVCYLTGISAGAATASGVLAPVLPATGSSAGAATVSGSLEAEKETTGSSAGVATVSGVLEAEKETTGLSSGVATASGVPAVVVPTVGTSEVGVGGVETVNPDYVLTTDGQLELKVADTEPYPLYQKL